jgi:apolipoprotein N-acyltransferase
VGRSLRGSFTVGLVFGLGFFFPLLVWVVNVAWFAWVALAIASALIFAVFAVAQRLLLNLRCWPLAVAGWWVAAEAFRDRWPWGGFPWGRLAMSQAGLPTQGWAAIGGTPLLTLVVALTGTASARLGPASPGRPGAPRRRRTLVRRPTFAATAGLSCLPAALPLDPVPPAPGPPSRRHPGQRAARPVAAGAAGQLAVTFNHAAATDKLADRRSPPAPQPSRTW